MPTLNGRNYTGVSGLNLRENNGAIRFETPLITPVVTTGERLLYVNSSNELIYQSGSSSTIIGAAGGAGATPSWETIFTADNTFTITPDTAFIIAGNRSTATDVLRITNSAGATGVALQLTNSTTSNKDINGTSSTWSVLGTGAATFLDLTLTGTTTGLTSSGALTWTLVDNSTTALSVGAAGDTNMMVFDTSNAQPIVKFNDYLEVVSGNATFISASNTVTNVLVTNNTITTFGADASSAGMVCLRSTSLTTGSLLQLQLSDTANAGGFYLTCRESVGGTNDLTIGENGVMVIAGTAASDSFTLTAGDMVLSDASLAITDADNAATFTVTNNTATSAAVVVIAGSGAFTGTTTTSFMTVTPSGLTSGTAIYMDLAALTTGKVLEITSASATDAAYITLTGNTANLTTTAKMINVDLVANVAAQGLKIATTGIYTGTAGMIDLDAGAMTTGVLLKIDSTTGLTSGSLIRATTTTTGAIATNGAISFVASGAHTGTIGFVHISDATATGIAMDITANSLTTGSALLVTSSGTVTSSSEGVVNIVASGMTTGSALKIDLTEGTLTTGKYINCYDDTATASVFSVGENGVVLYSDFTEVVTAANVITAAESGSVFFLNSGTEFASTLPALQAGLHFTFIVTAAPSGASYTITTDGAANNILGTVHSSDGVDADSEVSGAGLDVVTFVDGAAVLGDRAEFWCDGTNWFMIAHCNVSTGITIT